MPKVSVLISIYNHRAEYVETCLDSLHMQTLTDIEFILIDNGATSDAKALIDKYVKNDSRFKAIHIKENRGVARALNAGLDIAQGDYIGIVESDDFATPDMYEKLYNQIIKFDADVCLAGFYTYTNGKDDPNNIHTRQIFENSRDDKLFSILDYPFLFTCHQSIWAKLYRSDFIKKIRFYENGTYIDAQFITDLYCNTNKIIALKDYIYHYRCDNPNASNSNVKTDKSLMNILDDWQDAKLILQKAGYYELLKEELFYHATKPGYRFYKNIDKKYKHAFFKKWQKFVKELKHDKTFTYKYFNPEQKEFIKNVLKNKYYKTLSNNSNYSFWERIFSVKNCNDQKHKTINILGVRIKVKRKISMKQILNSTLAASNQLYFIQKSNIQAASVHPQTFGEYKNKHQGQTIVIVGCGPSLIQYEPLKNAIHIGINRAFLMNNVNLDYLFIQDRLKGQDNMEKVNKYRPGLCTKFYGIIPESRATQVKQSISRISNQIIVEANAKPYIIEDAVCRNWANNLEFEPIGDWQGCVFSALQFALYTNPKQILIVGCDCSNNGHFHAEFSDNIKVNTRNLSYQKQSWIKFKEHVNDMCPNTQIISVNPVELTGLFKDVYTQSYVDEHPELLNKNIEILDKGEELCKNL